MFWCIWRLSHHDISKKPWKKHQSQEGWVGRSGSVSWFSSGRCSRLGIPLEMEHGLRLRCCLPFQCWLQRADKARNFWMETLGLVTWWTRKEMPAKCDSLSIAWVLLDDFPSFGNRQRFLNYAFNERLEKLSKTNILLCHGLAPRGCDHLLLRPGGSFPSHTTTCVERAWWIRWQRMKIWVMIADMHKRVFYSCNMPFLEGDDIFDICPLVYDLKFCFPSSMHLLTTAQVYHWYVGAAFAFYGLRDWWLAASKAFRSCGQRFTDVVMLCPTRWCTRSRPSHRRFISKT